VSYKLVRASVDELGGEPGYALRVEFLEEPRFAGGSSRRRGFGTYLERNDEPASIVHALRSLAVAVEVWDERRRAT
jgi:hypothetical protein